MAVLVFLKLRKSFHNDRSSGNGAISKGAAVVVDSWRASTSGGCGGILAIGIVEYLLEFHLASGLVAYDIEDRYRNRRTRALAAMAARDWLVDHGSGIGGSKKGGENQQTSALESVRAAGLQTKNPGQRLSSKM